MHQISERGAADAVRLEPTCRIARGSEAAQAKSVTDFLDIARLQEPNPLLYRLFPLTCARSQE
jgi:hypothetical protein